MHRPIEFAPFLCTDCGIGLSLERLAVFLVLWLAGLIGIPYVPYEPARAMFSSFVAVLDIALVLAIFKGDVRLT